MNFRFRQAPTPPGPSAAPPIYPPTPRATRLNQGALVAALALAGLTVIVIVSYNGRATPTTPPVARRAAALRDTAQRPAQMIAAARDSAVAAGIVAPPVMYDVPGAGEPPATRRTYATTRAPGEWSASAEPPQPTMPTAREVAYQKALASNMVVGGNTDVPPSGTMGISTAATAVHLSVEPSPSPYTIQAGTLVPAVLLTGISSDAPGDVEAMVARDVYDTRTQQTVLIPKGAKLIGSRHDQAAVSEDRVAVAWTRLLYPDGRSIALPGLATKDGAGADGVTGAVDRHSKRVFGTAAMLSLLGAGAQLAQPRGGYSTNGGYPSPGQIIAGNGAQRLDDVAADMLRRGMDARPTIRIAQGAPFNVFLSQDLVFDAPAASATSAASAIAKR